MGFMGVMWGYHRVITFVPFTTRLGVAEFMWLGVVRVMGHMYMLGKSRVTIGFSIVVQLTELGL